MTITSNGSTISSNPLDPELQKIILMHEVGHWTVADHYGHAGQIEYDLSSGQAYAKISFRPQGSELECLKQKIEIGLGGLVAEKIAGFQSGGFLFGDLPIIFEDIKKRNHLLGKPFNYTKYGQLLMTNEFWDEQDSAHKILMSRGGRSYLESSAKYLFDEIRNNHDVQG